MPHPHENLQTNDNSTVIDNYNNNDNFITVHSVHFSTKSDVHIAATMDSAVNINVNPSFSTVVAIL